jgi:hypothetical protein
MDTKAGSQFNPIVVYQMGRVGSQSVVSAIEDCGLKTTHIHRLSTERSEIPLRRSELIRRNLRRWAFQAQKNLFTVKIVSAYRDPLKRNVSSFLRNYPRFTQGDGGEIDAEKLVDTFLTLNRIHRTPSTWFDEELLRFLGINVFSSPFPAEKGCSRHVLRNVELLVFRSDLLRRAADTLADFVRVPRLDIKTLNTSSHYVHDNVAEQFYQAFRPPDWMIDISYNTESCNHFFSRSEIDAMIAQWER